MEAGNVNDFLDCISYQDAAVLYKLNKYFFNGVSYDTNNGLYNFQIDLWDSNNCYVRTVFEVQSKTNAACIEEFLNAPIWDKKNFFDVEHEMIWVDW